MGDHDCRKCRFKMTPQPDGLSEFCPNENCTDFLILKSTWRKVKY